MRTHILVLLIFCIVILGGCSGTLSEQNEMVGDGVSDAPMVANQEGTDENVSLEMTEVCFSSGKPVCIEAEIASEHEDRMKGLMFRESLLEKSGMLFVFPEPGGYLFWMKNTLIPLDMIFLNEEKRVVWVEKDAPPCETFTCPSFGPKGEDRVDIKYVVEINAGLAEKYVIFPGQIVSFEVP